VGKNPYLSQFQLRTTGQLYLFSVPMSVTSHLQWCVESFVTLAAPWHWMPQPMIAKSQRTELPFRSNLDNLPQLVSALFEFPNLYAEIIRDPIANGLAERWLIVPKLGLKRLDINEVGDVVIDENQLRSAMQSEGDLATKISWLLAEDWERELEPLRISAANANARMLATGG